MSTASFREARDVVQPEKIAVAEKREALEAGERRREETRIGEFGGRERILRARVPAARDHLVDLDRIHFDRNGGAAQKREARDVVGFGLAAVPAAG